MEDEFKQLNPLLILFILLLTLPCRSTCLRSYRQTHLETFWRINFSRESKVNNLDFVTVESHAKNVLRFEVKMKNKTRMNVWDSIAQLSNEVNTLPLRQHVVITYNSLHQLPSSNTAHTHTHTHTHKHTIAHCTLFRLHEHQTRKHYTKSLRSQYISSKINKHYKKSPAGAWVCVMHHLM